MSILQFFGPKHQFPSSNIQTNSNHTNPNDSVRERFRENWSFELWIWDFSWGVTVLPGVWLRTRAAHDQWFASVAPSARYNCPKAWYRVEARQLRRRC